MVWLPLDDVVSVVLQSSLLATEVFLDDVVSVALPSSRYLTWAGERLPPPNDVVCVVSPLSRGFFGAVEGGNLPDDVVSVVFVASLRLTVSEGKSCLPETVFLR